MIGPRPLLVFALGAAIVGSAVIVATAPTDADVPAELRPWLEPARDLARLEGGLLAIVPFRYVDARCRVDGRLIAAGFASALGSARTFAVIGLPSESDAGSPGATVTIVGTTAAEFVAEFPDLAATPPESCDGALSP